jgi:Uma2 family endonuclease
MNAPVTLAAEGLPRRAFSVADVERMVEVGLLDPDERIELIGGELVPMSPKGVRHEALKILLNLAIARILPDDLLVAPETTFRMATDTYLEPDFVFYPASVGPVGLKPDNVKLVIEIADSSLGYDLGRKASLYASFGIKELWVMNARTRLTTIHRTPSVEGYRDVFTRTEHDILEAIFVPGLTLSLSNLDLPE